MSKCFSYLHCMIRISKYNPKTVIILVDVDGDGCEVEMLGRVAGKLVECFVYQNWI